MCSSSGIGLPRRRANVCQALRAQLEAPVLFLTARRSDRWVPGFSAGGDDYLDQALCPRRGWVARLRAL